MEYLPILLSHAAYLSGKLNYIICLYRNGIVKAFSPIFLKIEYFAKENEIPSVPIDKIVQIPHGKKLGIQYKGLSFLHLVAKVTKTPFFEKKIWPEF